MTAPNETSAQTRAPSPACPVNGTPPVVRLAGITKRFGSVTANDSISLDIHAGRVLALLGENGAGKSTLMSMLAGRYPPDEGRIEIDGRPVRFGSTREAIEAGIGMVYQHFMLVDSMTVAQNVLLGQHERLIVSPRRMHDEVTRLAERYGLSIDPSATVASLSMGERQRVEILKLLYRDSRVLIFDEPTAVLTPPEVGQLFPALERMAHQGKAIVFISHKLEEVLSLADDIAVLRRGQIVDTVRACEVQSKAELAARMVGREVLLSVERPVVAPGETVLQVEGMTGEGLSDISLELHQGEVLAVVGVAGNGQKALVEILAGLRKPPIDTVFIMNKPWRKFFAEADWKESLSYIPEDRLGLGALGDLDMVDNVLLTTRKGFARGVFLAKSKATEVTEGLIRDYDVRPAHAGTTAGRLSGGNLQKLVLAREFFRAPKLIIAEQPTQGLDIGATEEVWRRLLAAREHSGVLLVTGDVGEALKLADRVAVMFEGRFMDIFPVSDEARVERLGLLMAGVTEA